MPGKSSEVSSAELLPQVVEVARRAGKAIMAVYDLNFAVEMKKDESPLTAADLASHHVICDGLAALAPQFPVLSEESAAILYETRRNWETYWLVDPLDGTKDFMKRNGEFTVNIALMQNGSPILGVVLAPATGTAYYAAEGIGARKLKEKVDTPIKAAESMGPRPKLVISRWHGGTMDQMKADLVRIGIEVSQCEFVPMSSSLKLCVVADGTAHIYLRNGPTMEWDTDAAHCILKLAGGSMSDLDGNPLRYNKPDLLNPSFIACASRPIHWSPAIRIDEEPTSAPMVGT